ncbi:MAG: cbb3-type cytochrome c oxidase subunit I [Nitrosomonadales bacterium]|nr:cbb3-type cytochrome c oxidase subunit I [Nitrosomonadales bacterium]
MRLDTTAHPHLVKFLLVSAISFFIGAMHGMLQVLPPIRAWLDSIGSPYGGPGHMIDPLAHAHMNLVGGLVTLAMGTTYYLFPLFSGKEIYSARLVNQSFWWTSVGVFYFYITQMVFGIWEGNLLLTDPQAMQQVHHYYGPIVAGSGIVMATGFCIYLVNIVLSLRDNGKNP